MVGCRMMKTYVIEIDGKPSAAFRAASDEEASGFPDILWSPRSPLRRPEGTITVRPATIPERQRWTAASVEAADAINPDTGKEYDDDPNGLMVPLDEEE
jgi:hypothetical protein